MLRAVLDTNVVIRAETSSHSQSACNEIFRKWERAVIQILYCQDALIEYAEKLGSEPWNLPDDLIVDLIDRFDNSGEEIPLRVYHLEKYPEDMDDAPFLLCAVNGRASHLISYDHHLTDLAPHYDDEFRICDAPAFLADFRKSTKFLFEAGLARQVIDRRGSWYFYTGEATGEIRLGQGVAESVEAVGQNAEILRGLEQALNS